MIRVLSREPDRSMLGLERDQSVDGLEVSRALYPTYFSMEVAKLVTQPFCKS